MKTLKCVSPINGEVFAERPVMALEEVESALTRARAGSRIA